MKGHEDVVIKDGTKGVDGGTELAGWCNGWLHAGLAGLVFELASGRKAMLDCRKLEYDG